MSARGFRLWADCALQRHRATARTGLLLATILRRRLRMQGFIVSEDYAGRQSEFVAAMSPWLAAGKIKYREDVTCGNFGKLVVRMGTA